MWPFSSEKKPSSDKPAIKFCEIKMKNGFTLIELMVAVAVVAILASIAIPSYEGYIETTRKSTAKTTALFIKPYLEEYFLEKGTYVGWADNTVDTSNFGGVTIEKYSLGTTDYSLTIKLDNTHSYTFTKSEL